MRGVQVLVVEDDAAIAALVKEILEEEGWAVTLLSPAAPAVLQATVVRLAPDCILLDGAGRAGYGQSWLDAAWLHQWARTIPVIMFSVDAHATHEARVGASTRSRVAAFAGVVEKPFEVDELVAAVTRVLGQGHEPASDEAASVAP